MKRMFFSVDKFRISRPLFTRRRAFSLFHWSLRPGVAGAFLLTTLFGPASGWGQSRASQMLAGVQHDEFSTATEDAGHFSPERLRARIQSLDLMVSAHNARFARLQGRAFAGGGTEDVAPRVFQAALEKFQTAVRMNAEVEMRRARFSQKFAAAGGFQYRTFADGKRMWFKNGRVSRIENEKTVDAFGNTHRQDTTEMVYDKRGNLLSSKTETRDPNGHITVKRWAGTYSNVPGRDRLLSFSETTWDPLGNESRLERTDLTWNSDGKNLLSYNEKSTDQYGETATRRVWDSTHDKDGNLLSFKEESESKGVKSSREWYGATYKKAGKKNGKDEWQLTGYGEKSTDALGRETTRSWGDAKYDDKGALLGYTETTTGPDGKPTVRVWGDAEFDRSGNLTFFRETTTDSTGRATTRVFRHGRYDEHGRALSYEELTSSTDGPSETRRWSGGRYNERNELLAYREEITNSHGVTSAREWSATSYIKGQPAGTLETITDDLGHRTTREWHGHFGAFGRLAGFDEKTTDAQGNISTLSQDGLTYDALGRLVGYDEKSVDFFGRPTWTTWTATAHDLNNRVAAYRRTDRGEDGRERRSERANIVYDAAGRILSYEESLEATGGSLPAASGRQSWKATGYDRHGELTGFELTTTNDRGESDTQRRALTYDQKGRTVGTEDLYTNALGETQRVQWKALRFDAWGNAEKYSETITTAGLPKERVWEGTLDARGLASSSTEMISDSNGLKVINRLSGALYDSRGRMTDGVRSTSRSDFPDVAIESVTAGRTYDVSGQVTGGTETTRTHGRVDGVAVDLTTVETAGSAAFVDGRATQTRSTVETTGFWGGERVHTQDTTDVLLGMNGDRSERRTTRAFDAAGVLIKETWNSSERTDVTVDLSGRTLTYQETTGDAAAPKAKTITKRINHYHGNGELAGYQENSQNAFGVVTRTEVRDLATDALGQTLQSRETTTLPGTTVKTDETYKTGLRYDLLGRAVGGEESTATTGPGLSTQSQSKWSNVLDAAGRVVVSTSMGERDGVAFENETKNTAFDIYGRPIDYHTGSQGFAGVSDLSTSGVRYDEYGRPAQRHEDGWNNGNYSYADVSSAYDDKGREVETIRGGYNGQGNFRETVRTDGFNALGQAVGRMTDGWNATDGSYKHVDTALDYDLHGELIGFDREKTAGGKTDVSRWDSKGVNAQGRSLGFTETGKTYENGQFVNDFTIDHTPSAFNGNGQEVAYARVATKTFANGVVETTTTDWKGAYDAQGRMVEFRDEQTISLIEGGVTKEATLSRWREGMTYYEEDGDGHRRGMMSGYDETVFDSASPDKGAKTTVRAMRYDDQGRFLTGETATGEVSRLKDALRRTADVFSGGNLAQAGRNLVAGLERLLANTAQLAADVSAWLKENIAEPSKDFVETIARWLGAPGDAPPVLNPADVEKLVRAVSEKAGGVKEADVPLGLVPAAKTLGVFDQGLSTTRTKAKTFDAQGRAVGWVEETRSAAAPDKVVESEIRLTYAGDTNHVATYAARVKNGDKVSHIFRDNYQYDLLGRGTYREARFESDALEELVDGVPAAGAAVGTRVLNWAGLSAEARTALVDRLAADAVQVVGRVEIDVNESFEHDAAGNVVSRQGDRLVRGNVLTELGLEKILPQSAADLRSAAVSGIKDEIAGLIQKQDEILTGAATKLQQAAIDAERAEKSLEALLSERIPLEEQLKERQAARDSALAVFEAAMRAVSALLGKDLFTSLAGEKKGEEPGNSTTDARGRQVRYAAGDKTTVLDSQWFAVIRVRENGDVVRTYERRDVERTLVFRDDRDVRGWVEESRKDLAPTEDPNPPFKGVANGWNANKGVKLIVALPVFEGTDLASINQESIDALDAALATLRSQFEINNLKKLFPTYRSLDSKGIKADTEKIVNGNAAAQAGLQSSLKSLSTQLDTAQKFRKADNEWAGAAENLAIHDARVAEAQKALPVLKEALTLAEQDRAALEADTGREKAHLKADEEKRLAEVATELTEQVKNLTRGLAETEVWLGGATVQIPAGFWDALIEKGQAELNGSAWSIKDVEGAARARTRLFSNEKFVRLDENKPDGLSLTWRGDLTVSGKAGPPTFDALRAAGQKALAASTDDERRAAFGLTSDGRLSVSRVSAQTQDAAGRLVAQGVEVLDMTRQGGEVDVRRSTQDTQGFQYDTRGQVVGYTRTTREADKPDVVERLVGATYDTAGRLLTSDIRLRDPSSGYSGEVQLLTENLSFGPDGAPRHSRRTQIKDGQVSVVEDLGQSRTDALGRVVFSLTKNLSTSLDSWNKSGHNLATTEGERSTTAVWNTSFNVRGEVAASFRATSKTGAAGAWHTAFETTTTVYGAGGRATGSTTKTVEAGRDGAAVLFRSLTDQTLDIVYDAQGRALRQRSQHTENGLTTETWDEGDRLYDALGRLVRTHTKTRDAQGGESEAFWSGTYGAEGRLISTYRWTLSEGRKTEERSVGAAVVDAQGRTTFPETEVTEWDATGTESQTHRRTESGAVYNIFGMLVSQEVTTRTRREDGTTATETKNYTYGYDTAGRQTKTWVNGREEAGGQVRTYNSYNEVLAFDTLGRARRTFSRSVLGAVTTDRYSTQDVQYDAKGRTVASRDMTRRHGVDEKTGAILDTYTTEINETQAFDAWSRATAYTQTTLAGALKTVSAVQAVYGRDGRVVDTTTLYDESSLVAGSDHRVHREIRQTGMAYDGVGNLIDYVKTVTEGGLVTTHTPAMALTYDEFGRSINALERVRDNNGRDEVVGALGTAYNSFGQVVGGQTVTMKGSAALLDDKALIAEVAGRLKAGDLVSNGAGLVAGSGLEGVWSTRLLSAAYDAQGRQVYTDTVTDKAGHGFKDVVVDVVLAKGWVAKGSGSWYGQQFAAALAKLKAEGAEIVYSKFYHGGGVDRRYCESLITYRKKEAAILESHDRAENVVSVFDAFGRALEQTQVAHKGPNTTTTNQWLVYDNAGRMSRVFSNIREEGLNGDGTVLFRTLSQSQEFTYDGLGRTAKETTVTWADSQAPYKITTATTDGISYQDGQRMGWTETSGSNDRTTEDVRVITGAGYDGLGRLATYDATVYEKNNGVLKLQYKDLNVRNSYDALGRMALTLSDRVWGTTEQVKVAAKDKHGLKVTTVTRTVEKPVEKGQGGGGIAGLSEDWTTGRAAVAISYDYGNDGSSLSGMRVLAYGTGTHKEKSVQAAGIRLEYHQKNMKYDGVGRVTGYKLITTQVERYQYYKQGQSGLKRKVKSAWTTGAVTTVSDVVVKEYDGYGRQVHTVVTSQRNDINRTWTRTETIVKSFDEQGRVKDVKRTTDSKITLPKSSGGLMGSVGGLALGALLAITGVGLVLAIGIGIAVGLGGAAANWLGGQKIYSHNVVEQTMAYKADGSVDEEKTKAQTRTLEEKSYMMGQNFGDKMMMVSDIVVAVVAVVTTVMTVGATTGFWAAVGASLVNLAPTVAYQAARQGISINDFEAHPDRDNARNSRMMVVNYVGQSLLAGMGSSLRLAQGKKAYQTASAVANAAPMDAAVLALKASQGLQGVNVLYFSAATVGFNMASAAAGGAKGKKLITVGAISTVNGLLGGYNVSSKPGNVWWAGGGELIRQAGMTYGKSSQRTTWMLLGTGVSSASGGMPNIVGTVGKSLALTLYSKNNDGGTNADRYQRGFVLQSIGEFLGTLTSIGVEGFKKASLTQTTQSKVSNFFNALLSGIAAPFAAISEIPENVQAAFEALFVPRFQSANSIDFPDGSRVIAQGIKIGREGSVVVPVGARREVFDIGGGPVRIGDLNYSRGSFVFDGNGWVLDGEGVVMESGFGGLMPLDGGAVPVVVRGSNSGIERVGVLWDLMEGRSMRVSSPTDLPGIGMIFAGSIKVLNSTFHFSTGSIYQGKDDLYATYLMPVDGNAVKRSVQVNGNQFRLVLNQMKLGTGETIQIVNADLGGTIENGVAVFKRREGNVQLVLQNGSMTARGEATIKWTDRGIQLTGYLDGDMNVVMNNSVIPSNSRLGFNAQGGTGRNLVPGDFTALSTKGMTAHIRGRVALTEAGPVLYTEGTRFNTTEKAVIWKDGVAYNSGRSIERFLVAGGEVTYIPPGAAAYLPDQMIRMGVESLIVSRLGVEIKDQKDWDRAEAFEIREILLRSDAGGKFKAEVWHDGVRLAVLKSRRVGMTFIVVDHNGAKRPISLVPGGTIERNLDVQIGTKEAIRGIFGGYYDKVRGHVGRFTLIMSAAGARAMGAYERTSVGIKAAVSPLTALFQPALSMSRAATLVGGQPAEVRAETYMKMANTLDGSIMVGNYKIAATDSLLANSRGLTPNQQAGAKLLNGVLAPVGALTEFLGVHSLAYYDKMGGEGRVVEAAMDDLKVGGRNAAIGGVVGGLVAYFGKPVLIIAGFGFGTVTALGSSASSLRGKIADGVGAGSLMFLGAGMMRRRPTSGLYGAARVRAAFKSAGVSALDNTFGGIGLIENGLGRMHMSLVGAERAAELGMTGVKGAKFAGLSEGRLQVGIFSEGGRIPNLAELKNIAQKAHDQKLTVEIMFGDRASVRAFQKSPELMSLVGPEGLQNLKVIGKYELKLAERHKERLLEQKDYQAALKVKKEAALFEAGQNFASNEIGIKVWEGRHQSIIDATFKLQESFSKGEVSADGLVAKIKEYVPGWEPSKELIGELRGAEAALRGIERGGEGLAQSPQDASGGIGFLQRLSNRFKDLVQGNRREVRPAGTPERTLEDPGKQLEAIFRGEQAASAGAQAASAGGEYASNKISFLRTENERIVNERPGLQNEIRVAGERVALYQNRADKVTKRIEGLLKNLGSIQERIAYWESSTFQEQVAPPLRLTPEWKRGARVSVRDLLANWREDVSRGLDPAYSPYLFNFNKPKVGNIFDAIADNRAPPNLIGELLSVLGEGDGKVRLVSVRGSADIARRFVSAVSPEKPSGVLGEKLNKDARHGQAVYLTARVETGLRELNFHGAQGTHYNVYELDFNKSRVLDLTDPRVIDLFRPEYGDNYQLTAKSAYQARLAGYDVVMYESVRDRGALNFAVIAEHDSILRVDPMVYDVPAGKKLKVLSTAEKTPYRAGKEALVAQRGGILAPAGEVNRPFRSLWNRLLGRRETVTNPPANGPPMNLADDFSTDRPIPAAVPRAENNPTIKTIAADDMGFQGGRPISADHPNLSRGPPNQFKDFLENQASQKLPRTSLPEKTPPAQGMYATPRILPKPVNYESFGLSTSDGRPVSWERLNEVLSPPPEKSYFWSGRTDGIGGELNAQKISQNTGGVTLEGLLRSNDIAMPKQDHPMSRVAWDEISRVYAESAAGTVRVVLGEEVRQGSVWNRIEYETLKANPNVKEIIAVDPHTREERKIFHRLP